MFFLSYLSFEGFWSFQFQNGFFRPMLTWFSWQELDEKGLWWMTLLNRTQSFAFIQFWEFTINILKCFIPHLERCCAIFLCQLGREIWSSKKSKYQWHVHGDPKKMYHKDSDLKYVLDVRFYFSTCVLESEFRARFI